jgi:ATP/maltotriose-dependent transcriptional regulator MalT
VWGRLTAIAVPTTTGALAHTIGVVEDITTEKALEAQLAAAERQLAELRAVAAEQARELARVRAGLTKTEWRVLELLGEGLTNARIAARLSIAPATVKTHIHNLYAKLQVAERSALITLAREWSQDQTRADRPGRTGVGKDSTSGWREVPPGDG